MKGRKGKKKTFTTPKKTHHEKKKEPLAVLKMYKVDTDTGGVEKLRKECPGSLCGPGTFMAAHSDRLSCGKCGLTYFYQDASAAVAATEVSAAA